MSNDAEAPLPQAFLIDLDGTLVDHYRAICRCYQMVCEELGAPIPTLEEVKRGVGGSTPVTARKFFPADRLEEGIALWRERFETFYLDDVELMPGARELLDAIRRRGGKAAVFTNKIGRHARGLCDALGLTPLLEFALGAEDTPHRKPQRAFSLLALQRIGAAPEKAAMIGDSPFDIEAAKAVGMASWIAPTGAHSAAELRAAGADRLFPDLNAIARFLDGGKALAQEE